MAALCVSSMANVVDERMEEVILTPAVPPLPPAARVFSLEVEDLRGSQIFRIAADAEADGRAFPDGGSISPAALLPDSPQPPTNIESDEEAIEGSGGSGDQWSRSQIIKLFVISLALTLTTNFPSAFLHTSVNTAGAEVVEYLNESYVQRGAQLEEAEYVWLRSIIASSWYAGQILGAQFSPFITDRYGRKPAYLLATLAMTTACFIQSVATMFPYPELMIAGRVLASFFSPLSDAAAILYLQEISPTHLRGVLSSLFTTTYSIMALFGMVMGMESVLGYSLTLLLFVPVLPGLLSLGMLLYIPETPKFLMISKRNSMAARHSLAFYQGDQIQADRVLHGYQCEAKEESMGEARMLDLFRVFYLRRAMVLTFMVLALCLPFYPILQYSTTLLVLIGIDEQLAAWSSSLIGLEMVVGCLVAALMLKHFKRRSLLMFFGGGSVVSMLLFSSCGSMVAQLEVLKYVAMAGLFGYIACWSMAVGPISFFIGTELVPIQHRSTMFCVCFALTNILIFFTNGIALALFRVLGAICFLPLFVVPSVLALVYIWQFLPETKNKETHVIVAKLKDGHRRGRRMVKTALVIPHLLENEKI